MDKDRTNIDLVKERTDIVSVISRYVKLSQAGKNLKGLCPFHSEKTPSFNVSPDLNIYKCFGCGKSGDVINFIEEIEKIDFNQALEKLAKEAGISLEKANTPQSPVMLINNWAKLYFQKELTQPTNKYPYEYLLKRGITNKQISDFEIGYAPGNGQFLNRLNKYRSFSKSILIDSGLFIEKNGVLKEKFAKRIMFPVHNLSGKVIAFSGRKLPNNDLGPKYLNSPETSIYQKRNNLYGLFQSKASIKKDDLCILVEAQTGVIALAKAGFTNAVAPLGTGLTDSQLELIKRYTNNLLFIFDNDMAGQSALEKAFHMATKLNINTYAINTGKFKDIDELIQSAPDNLKGLIEGRMDTFTYLITQKIESIDLTQLKSIKRIESFAKSLIQSVTDETTRNYYIQKIKSLVPEIDLDLKITATAKQFTKNTTQHTIVSLEDMYIKSVLNSIKRPEILPDYKEVLESQSNILILETIEKHNPKELKDLISLLQSNINIVTHIQNLTLLDKQVDDSHVLINRILINYHEKKLKNIRILLATAEEKEDTNTIEKLLEKVVELTDKIKKLKNENIKL